MKIAIIASEFNKDMTDRLLRGAEKALGDTVPKIEYDVFRVPGAFEIPYRAARLADTKKYSGIIALGVVIKGETDHYEAICQGVTYGIQKVSIEHRLPIMFGILMCKNRSQAFNRASDDSKNNKGHESALALLKILEVEF